MLFPAGLFYMYQRSHLQCHGLSLAVTCYTMASVLEPCEGSRHFIENGSNFGQILFDWLSKFTCQFCLKMTGPPSPWWSDNNSASLERGNQNIFKKFSIAGPKECYFSFKLIGPLDQNSQGRNLPKS